MTFDENRYKLDCRKCRFYNESCRYKIISKEEKILYLCDMMKYKKYKEENKKEYLKILFKARKIEVIDIKKNIKINNLYLEDE